jgi:SAM-dependent methyltransferase
MSEPHYRAALARVHHEGLAFHAEDCAPAILALLEQVRERGGLVLELGCGSGLLTRRLVEAGHRVVATDASPAMLDLARETAPRAEIARLTLPGDDLPAADAIVSVGHTLNYLPSVEAIDEALAAMAEALRPGGVLAIDLCGLGYAEARRDDTSRGWLGDGWALVTRFSTPAPDRFVREMTIFTDAGDGTWRRDDERHDNVLVDVDHAASLLAANGVPTEVRPSFGGEPFPEGLFALVGRRTA